MRVACLVGIFLDVRDPFSAQMAVWTWKTKKAYLESV